MILIVLLGAILVDLLIGDPRWLPHPVRGLGWLISCLEKRWNRGPHRKIKGIGLTLSVTGFVLLVTFLLTGAAYHVHWLIGVLLEMYLISTTIAIKGLRDAAQQVAKPLDRGDLDEARQQLNLIVGRDTHHLPEPEIVRGTVETVAENTVDGITAPLFWAFIGGAPFALAYRAANTLDSMVGYKHDRLRQFGWASARWDDVLNWIPSRLTALCMWLASFLIGRSKLRDKHRDKGRNKHRDKDRIKPQAKHKHALTITWRDARKHPSPNAGWPEAMVAGLLGVQLGGVNYYEGEPSERARLGDPLRGLEKADIQRGIRYMHGGWISFYFLLTFVYIFMLFLIW